MKRDAEERRAYRRRQREVVANVVHEYAPGVPIAFDVDVGHTEPEVPVPIGGRVVLDPERDRIAFP